MAIELKDLDCVKPEALAPGATEAKCETVAVGKTKLEPGKCFVLAMLAGIFIGFGATFFLTFTADPTLSFGVKKVVGGLCFCVGLVMVLCCGAELFTGNSLMVEALASKKITWGGLLKNWVIVLVGNLVGSLLLVFLVSMAGIASIKAGDSTVGANMATVAAGKINLPWEQIFFRGILCNMLVCFAVWIGFSAKTIADKVLGILLPISCFVACGFEHCVANMFFLPMGMVADPSKVDVAGICYNLSASIPGNIVGGTILVGLAYWYAYHKKEQA